MYRACRKISHRIIRRDNEMNSTPSPSSHFPSHPGSRNAPRERGFAEKKPRIWLPQIWPGGSDTVPSPAGALQIWYNML